MTPQFTYALTQSVLDHCPAVCDGKEIQAIDFLPKKANDTDTGLDVRCAELNEITYDDDKGNKQKIKGFELQPNCYFKIKLGLRVYAPTGWWISLSPRSSTFIKSHIHALYGVIDEGFENELCFVGQFVPNACDLISANKKYIIPFGHRIAQIIAIPRYEQEVKLASNEELDAMYQQRQATRGISGFGGSGRV